MMMRFGRVVARRKEEIGQGLVEYALILVLIPIVSIGIVTTIGDQVLGLFTTVAGTLTP